MKKIISIVLLVSLSLCWLVGCEFYGKKERRFDELCHWLQYKEIDITKVSIRTTDRKDRYSFIETRYSTKQEDIENFKAITRQTLIKVDQSVVSDIDYTNVYAFYYNEKNNGSGAGALTFYDEFYNWYDFDTFQFFKLEDENFVLPTIENPDLITYSFAYDGYSSDVKKRDDPSVSFHYFEIASVEFVPYVGEDIDIQPDYYIDSRYGFIYLLTPTIFRLNGQYYEIVSGETYWAYNYLQLGEK